jgi:cellulose synthase/poly-beta-1,6-N-acetylglucosamine synthase-like glycosyltransferase/peptidoglycan/xylan/chitin deacetylase (PgdA/CDA1 family)/spore germination protein YaaH
VSNSSFIFLDRQGTRWRRVKITSSIGLFVLLVSLTVFGGALLIDPAIESVDHESATNHAIDRVPHENSRSYSYQPPPQWLGTKRPTIVNGRIQVTEPFSVESSSPEKVSSVQQQSDVGEIRAAFYDDSDFEALKSFSENGEALTHILPYWYTLTSVDLEISDTSKVEVSEEARGRGVRVIPVLTNLKNDTWQSEPVEELLRAGEEEQSEFITGLIERLASVEAAGLLIDWEGVDPVYQSDLSIFMKRLHKIMVEHELELWFAIPLGGDLPLFDFVELKDSVDHFLALTVDENGQGDEPGPIASMPWYADWVRGLSRLTYPGQWIGSIPTYGYDWEMGKDPVVISFGEGLSRAKFAELGAIKNADTALYPNFSYYENGARHEVYFSDFSTFFNHFSVLREYGFAGFVLSDIGREDAAVWKMIESPDFPESGAGKIQVDLNLLESIGTIPPSGTISHIGKGDILLPTDGDAPGKRTFELNNQGFLTVNYSSFPEQPTIYHIGNLVPSMVSLTFDDGPDPEWTPAVLEILRAQGITATFFVTGENAQEHPELLKRIVNEGHEVGNHSFSHPNLSQASISRIKLELNSTQRVIESAIGRSVVLFRPPYNADTLPHALEDFTPLRVASELGYIPITESIDTEDWDLSSPEVLVNRVKERREAGSIVLLHDGGGDRSRTVAALPAIINYLKMRGDQIVPLKILIGTTQLGKDFQIMPPLAREDSVWARTISQFGLEVLHVLQVEIYYFVCVGLVLVLSRILIVVILAVLHRRKEVGAKASSVRPLPDTPAVSVVIAAYNEGRVILDTLTAIIRSSYPGESEILVIDDGSSDDTGSKVSSFARSHPSVRLISQENRGKSHALNAGIAAASHEIIITLDADTLVSSTTIPELVAMLQDERVGAVSGHVRVGNVHSWLTNFQDIEYLMGFHLDRRAYDYLGGHIVVPGAVSAWRRKALKEIGNFSTETLAEDTDATLALQKRGYLVRYASKAIGFTEAPDTVRILIRQRIRWAFGTMQCAWKHRSLIGSRAVPALGFLLLPAMWIFNFFLAALAPIVDILFILSLFEFVSGKVFFMFGIFLLLEGALAGCACLMEGVSIWRAVLIVPSRIVYRPILSVALWLAILRVFRGAWVGWGKQERRGKLGRSEAKVAIPGVATTMIILTVLFLGAGCNHTDETMKVAGRPPTTSGSKLLPPEKGAYPGAYLDAGHTEDKIRLEAIEDFTSLIGKDLAIVAFSSYWGEKSFPTDQARMVAQYGAVPLIFWSPWDVPYVQRQGPDAASLLEILGGKWDAYIDSWGVSARKHGGPILVAFGNEMNGSWFPWSGIFYGGGRPGQSGGGVYQGPETFKRAFRYVVTRVRAAGATNVSWVFHANNTSDPDEPWNKMAQYWPGAEYVDWIGLSAYGKQYPGPNWPSAKLVLEGPYAEACALDPVKPFIFAEWGIGEYPQQGSKAEWMREALSLMENEMPRLKAAVYWHERWQNQDESVSNLRVHSSRESLHTFRDQIGRPFWVSVPIVGRASGQ